MFFAVDLRQFEDGVNVWRTYLTEMPFQGRHLERQDVLPTIPLRSLPSEYLLQYSPPGALPQSHSLVKYSLASTNAQNQLDWRVQPCNLTDYKAMETEETSLDI